MAAPKFSSTANGTSAKYAADVVLDADISPPAAAFYIGGAGDLALRMGDGTTTVFPAVANGIFPVGASRVLAAGTTATGLRALWN